MQRWTLYVMTRMRNTTSNLGTHVREVEGGTSLAERGPDESAMSVGVGADKPFVSEPGKRADPNAPGLKNRARFLIELVSDTAERFADNDGYRLGAAFSYY